MIPREGVESIGLSLDFSGIELLHVIPREGVESVIVRDQGITAGLRQYVIPREGVESRASPCLRQLSLKACDPERGS